MRRPGWLIVLLCFQVSCVTEVKRPARPDTIRESDRLRAAEKLERIGLTVIPDAAAWIPDEERHRVIPCQAHNTEFGPPPVPPHPAGYLIVGFDQAVVPDRDRIWGALVAWTSRERLNVRIRRNPYRQIEETWWEVDVPLILPAPDSR